MPIQRDLISASDSTDAVSGSYAIDWKTSFGSPVRHASTGILYL
jgi:hypothetical protein